MNSLFVGNTKSDSGAVVTESACPANIRVEVVYALASQLRDCKKKSKKDLLRYRLREAMRGVGYLELPDGSAAQWVQKPWLKCGGCNADIQSLPEVEIIYAV